MSYILHWGPGHRLAAGLPWNAFNEATMSFWYLISLLKTPHPFSSLKNNLIGACYNFPSLVTGDLGGIKTSKYLLLLSVSGGINTHSFKPGDQLLHLMKQQPGHPEIPHMLQLKGKCSQSKSKAWSAEAAKKKLDVWAPWGPPGTQDCEVVRPVSQWSRCSLKQLQCRAVSNIMKNLSAREVRWDLPAVCNC